MAQIVYFLIFSTCILATPTNGQYYHFKINTAFSSKVLKNTLLGSFRSSTRSLLKCATKCDRSCRCFGFNALSKMCLVFKSCVQNDVIGHEDGWIHYSSKKSGEVILICITLLWSASVLSFSFSSTNLTTNKNFLK